MRTFLAFTIMLISISSLAQNEIESTFNDADRSVRTLPSISFGTNGNKIWSLNATEGVVKRYDDSWIVDERHSAGQKEVVYPSYQTTVYTYYDGELTDTQQYDPVTYTGYKYSFYTLNGSSFLDGSDNKLFWIRKINNSFVEQRIKLNSQTSSDRKTKTETWTTYYRLLTTGVELVDYDGNVINSFTLPYICNYSSMQIVNIANKSYLILWMNVVYPKDLPETINDNPSEYNIKDVQIDPDYDHYFIYEFDRVTESVRYVGTEKSAKGKNDILGIYDLGGTKLDAPQKGINLFIYTDGTCEKKVIE